MVSAAAFTLHADGQQPIAATLDMIAPGTPAGAISARFDWRHTGAERWDIAGETAAGTRFLLSDGGGTLHIDDALVQQQEGANPEYRAVYAAFAEHVDAGRSSIDPEPLRLLADANLVARRTPG
jgi:D-galactose 1-dehydrogenase